MPAISLKVTSSCVSYFQTNEGKFRLIKIPDLTLIPIKAPKNSNIFICEGYVAAGLMVPFISVLTMIVFLILSWD